MMRYSIILFIFCASPIFCNTNSITKDITKNDNLIIPEPNYFSRWRYFDSDGNGIGSMELWDIVGKEDLNKKLIFPGKVSTITSNTSTIISFLSLLMYTSLSFIDNSDEDLMNKVLPGIFISTLIVSQVSSDIEDRYTERAVHNYNN